MAQPKHPFEHVAAYAHAYRTQAGPLHPTVGTEALRAAFCQPLQDAPMAGDQVIADLIAAAEPGLVRNTDPNFYAWVMGASDPVGVAADWLTSTWGQNAAIFQTSPAAAVAEEAVGDWLLDLLNLPRESSVGFVTGATMATFVALAAARTSVLDRAGYDYEQQGLQGAPLISIFTSDDVHVSNLTALRYLGFGDGNLVRVASDEMGLMQVDALKQALAEKTGPKIIIAQAGHINSGGFEDFTAIADLAKAHDAWLHIDGAFGLWAQMLPEKSDLTKGVERADSWSVDGHKWLQIPYDSGFAIIRNTDAHRRAMDVNAGYLNRSETDGRSPANYVPELSRRARGFAAWAVLRALGRDGIRKMVHAHCDTAEMIADSLNQIRGLSVGNSVCLNQIILSADDAGDDEKIEHLAEALNETYGVFVKTAEWKGRLVLRLSVVSQNASRDSGRKAASAIAEAWNVLQSRI